MKRREFITLLGSGAVAWPLAARAQQPNMWRIGVLETTSLALNAANFTAFRQGLRDLGYAEGQNLVIEYRSTNSAERFSDLATELVRLKVDLIVLRGAPAVLAAKSATATIPIVMVSIADPLIAVASLAHPGGNVTGFSSFVSELEPKRIELIREIVPGAARIAALYNMANPIFLPRWQQMERVAQSVGIQPQLLDVRKPEDFEHAFGAAMTQRADALVVSNDGLTLENRKLIAELAAKYRLPAVYAAREFVDAGGLIAYAISFPDLYRRAATYVDKILKGTKPADLPVQQPTRFELVINLKAAKALGLAVPPTLLAIADEVIE
jgi:putative tryptophan/tyrosine transport system substrate-binding protein